MILELEGLDARLLDALLDLLAKHLGMFVLLALTALVVPEHLLQTHKIYKAR